MAVTGSEEAEITPTVDLYVEGVRNGDGAKLRGAFHPQAWMFGSVAGARYDEPIGELIALVEEHPADVDGSFKALVVSVEQVGDAAFAVLEEQGFWGTVQRDQQRRGKRGDVNTGYRKRPDTCSTLKQIDGRPQEGVPSDRERPAGSPSRTATARAPSRGRA